MANNEKRTTAPENEKNFMISLECEESWLNVERLSFGVRWGESEGGICLELESRNQGAFYRSKGGQ